MVRSALALAKRGLAVFPCRPQDKRPATVHGCKDASTNAELIRYWWEQDPAYNIGVATGAPSGLFVVDVDGLDAEAELSRLEHENGDLPPTVEVITARGRHLYFQLPADVPIPNSAGKIAAGIDVRGTGGYVLAPPSMHPSGRMLVGRQSQRPRAGARLALVMISATDRRGIQHSDFRVARPRH